MKTVISWSSGKDCAFALHRLLNDPDHDVVGLLTTLDGATSEVAMHRTPEAVLDAQAAAIGLPLTKIAIPWPCSNDAYEAIMGEAVARLVSDGVEQIAFGDLFLADIRKYREQKLAGTGLAPMFPLWGRDTSELAAEMMSAGLAATVVTVDTRRLDQSMVGKHYDRSFIAALPPGVDPCGENGEFHTCVTAGPMFREALSVTASGVMVRDGFASVRLSLV